LPKFLSDNSNSKKNKSKFEKENRISTKRISRCSIKDKDKLIDEILENIFIDLFNDTLFKKFILVKFLMPSIHVDIFYIH
jgi:hypothetical protein